FARKLWSGSSCRIAGGEICFFATGMTCNFSLATAMGGSRSLPELYVLQTSYSVFLPVLMFGIPVVVDFWVQSLPMHVSEQAI
ncbi:unnamed protein product, partial [Ectocarpus fasciculatus]